MLGSLGCSPATSTQMVSLVSRSRSIASRRTVQIGSPSRVVACRSLKSGRIFAAPDAPELNAARVDQNSHDALRRCGSQLFMRT